MKDKQLTCKTYLKELDETKVVARLDSDDLIGDQLVIEPGETYDVDWHYPWGQASRVCKMPDRYYLVGEVADRLYAYEQLGYSPEELKKIVEEHKRLTAVTKTVADCKTIVEFKNGSHLYVTTARQNGKSLLDAYKAQRAIYDYIVTDNHKQKFVRGEFIKDDIIGPSDKTVEDLIHESVLKSATDIENVIFNDPATIVFWKDGTKTVVKATNEEFDPEKGLAMAIAKKALGNKHEYYNVFKKWLKKYEKGCKARTEKMRGFIERVVLKKEDTP